MIESVWSVGLLHRWRLCCVSGGVPMSDDDEVRTTYYASHADMDPHSVPLCAGPYLQNWRMRRLALSPRPAPKNQSTSQQSKWFASRREATFS